MTFQRIPGWLRERVSIQAKFRCGYCLMSERIVGIEMEIDHLIPYAVGGKTEEQNLWLACSGCNGRKADRVLGIDPATKELVRRFDPRQQAWDEHFQWLESGATIEGLTSTGRATVATLQLNRSILVIARRAWVAAGWHPPKD